MEKKFERNIGDPVWIMYEDKPVCGNISSIDYSKVLSEIDYETITENEKYRVVANNRYVGLYNLSDLFDTKEDLIKSL